MNLPLKDLDSDPCPTIPTGTYIYRVTITPNVSNDLYYCVFSYMYGYPAYLVTHPTRQKPIRAPPKPTHMVVNSR